jgi:hypothetical protein
MALTDFVRTQISVQISAITRAGFGTMLFVYEGGATETDDRVLQFANVDEVEAKYGASDPATNAATAFFGGDLVSPLIKIGYKLTGETWAEALSACQTFDPDWYAFAIDSAVEADVLAASAWAQPRTKLYFAKSADAEILDVNDDTDVASQILDLSRDRTALVYHSLAASAYPELAWAGGQLPKNPGSTTWAFKPAPGIPADSFAGSEVSSLKEKRVNYIENVAGITIVAGGYTSRPGFFVDVRRGLDYVVQRLNEDVFILLTSNDKVPGDDRGSAMVESVIRARLAQSVAEDIFIDDDNLTVTVPLFEDRDIADRAARLLTGCKFTANLAGAIHEVEITGEVRA